jgi:hypothetical protein
VKERSFLMSVVAACVLVTPVVAWAQSPVSSVNYNLIVEEELVSELGGAVGFVYGR